MLLAVEMQNSRLLVNHRFQMHQTAPKGVNMFQGFSPVSKIELGAFIEVFEIQFAVAVVIPIFDLKIRESEVCHVRDKLVPYLLPSLFRNRPLLIIDEFENEEVEFLA